MKILIVCRWHGDHVAGFITEQADALCAQGHDVRYAMADQGGVKGYKRLLRKIRNAIDEWHPDIIHAYYGIYGLIANLQRKVPVVTTYLGADINIAKVKPISIVSSWLSAYNIFVSRRQLCKMTSWVNKTKSIVMCFGIKIDVFETIDKKKARQLFENAKPEDVTWSNEDKLVLFASKFNRVDKDPKLAQEVIKKVAEHRTAEGMSAVHLLPLTGEYTKEEMKWLMNAVDAALLTSPAEGSPQFIKEVMSCGCPIVSVDVGDVAERIEGVDGCWVAQSRQPEELAILVEKALNFQKKTNGREKLIEDQLSNEQVAKRLIDIYEQILNEKIKR